MKQAASTDRHYTATLTGASVEGDHASPDSLYKDDYALPTLDGDLGTVDYDSIDDYAVGSEDMLHSAETGAASASPLPAGQRRVGRGRGRERVKRYALAKAIGNWILRHRDASQEAAQDSGMQLGNALAVRVVDLDRKQSARRKTPITAKGIEARHRAIIHVLIEGLAAAGQSSTQADEYARQVMQQLHADFQDYGQALLQAAAAKAFPKPAGSLWKRVKSLRRGAARKVRALLNERDLRIMISTIIRFANMAVPRPGEVAVPGYGRDADVARQIRTFRRRLADMLTTRVGGRRAERVVRNDSASMVAIDFMYGALFAFVTHPELLSRAPKLVADADTHLDAFLPQDTQEEAAESHVIETSQKKAPKSPKAFSKTTKPVFVPPDASKALASTLIQKSVKPYLHHNSTTRERAKRHYALMVPGDKRCLAKVLSKIQDNGRDIQGKDENLKLEHINQAAATKYIEHALLARHPHKKRDQNDYLLSLSGTVFHLSKDTVLRQMQRVQSKSSDLHTAWERESSDEGGALFPHPNRLAMQCVVGKTLPVGILSENGSPLLVRPLFYWPIDSDNDDDDEYDDNNTQPSSQ